MALQIMGSDLVRVGPFLMVYTMNKYPALVSLE